MLLLVFLSSFSSFSTIKHKLTKTKRSPTSSSSTTPDPLKRKKRKTVQGLFVEGRAGAIGHGETSLLDGLVGVAELGVVVKLALRDRLEVLEEGLDGRKFSEAIGALLHVLYNANDRGYLSARRSMKKNKGRE